MTEKIERELKRVARLLDEREQLEDIVIRRVEEALKKFRWAPPKLPRLDTRKSVHEEVCVIHLSDTQIGKLTKSYDSSVAAERIAYFGKIIEKIVTSKRTGSKINDAVLMIGGDIVEGETIFAHQPWCVDSDLWDQAIKVAPQILSDLIIHMASIFRTVRVYAVPGNHGRSQPKNSGASPRTNFDMIATQITRLMVSKVYKDTRVSWDIDHNEFYCVIPVLGHNILLIHGDQISGGGGLGGYPLTGLARKIAGWSASIPDNWESIFLGHFHRPMSGVIQNKMFFANGTTESDNDFALEVIGESGSPCQRVVFYNKEHGPIADSLVWLD